MAMKPILFNTDMVRAILDGRKTVTRRAIKDKDIINAWDCESDGTPIAFIDQAAGDSHPPTYPCQYQPGDILYVRETWASAPDLFGEFPQYIYRADYSEKSLCMGEGTDETMTDFPACVKWRPSIHMPKEAARLFLRVTDVLAERLHDITDEQAKAEGVQGFFLGMGESGYAVRADSKTFYEGPVGAFASLWNSTIKPADMPIYGWNANPWVWVINFERISRDEAQKGGEG